VVIEMNKLATEEEAILRYGDAEGTKTVVNDASLLKWLESNWDSEANITPTGGAVDHRKNTGLVIFLVALSLTSIAGLVVKMGLVYGFSKPWLWEW
jgi:hypothetical protein